MYASLKDVAARAGVSFQTASKVLNGGQRTVSEHTRERILKAAAEVGYVPNALAQALAGHLDMIGMLVDDLADPALSRLTKSAEQAVTTHGLRALIVTAPPGSDPVLAVRKLREHRVAGILVIAPGWEEHAGLGRTLRGSLPVVSVNHIHGGRVPLVGSDHPASGRLAAEHLVELGHRRIATVTGVRTRRVVRSRHQGFRERLHEAGMRLPVRLVAEADWSPAAARDATMALLDAEPGLTAIFVHSDVMALGVLAALREREVRIPQQCSVVSCDDLDLAAYTCPPLTTVAVPFCETGRRAVELLLQRVRGEHPPSRVLVPTRLVIRGSTAQPARAGPARARPANQGRTSRHHARSSTR